MEKNTGISERVSQLIDFLGINANEFAKKLGYKRSQTIYDILTGKSAPSFDFFYRLLNTEYSEFLNLEWLIAEKGSITKEIAKSEVSDVGRSKYYLENKDINYKETIEALHKVIAAQDKTIQALEMVIASKSEGKKTLTGPAVRIT